ncbi:hypothetical protein B0T10DRAFT_454450 [Thelonectria olida]|uniref:Inhibitor I9 domain-containing protein n=1 Tax=Thelonectria olida TaxID=1576542 RepID=A0A9P9ATQ2_9HYPO|nr:hypothetical protein B0T10DRAFT_454450 [Thelonectria olida]
MQSKLFALALVPALVTVTAFASPTLYWPSEKGEGTEYTIVLHNKTSAQRSAFSEWLEKTHENSRGGRNGTFTGITRALPFNQNILYLIFGRFDDETVEAIAAHPDVEEISAKPLYFTSEV